MAKKAQLLAAFCRYNFFCGCLVDFNKKKKKKISFGYFIQCCRCISAQFTRREMKTPNENNLSKKGETKLCVREHRKLCMWTRLLLLTWWTFPFTGGLKWRPFSWTLLVNQLTMTCILSVINHQARGIFYTFWISNCSQVTHKNIRNYMEKKGSKHFIGLK